ncbi:MobH family relaxase [Pseudomonas sp. NA-150]|uniref:MobH family relaxase n=1 Tax=Pseudomonas sp. NA-150 TaxID=3367525 RepID=UPI0037CAFEE3
MVWKLNWKKEKGCLQAAPQIVQSGTLHAESAPALLGTPRRQKLLEHIWQRTSLSRKQFDQLYLAPLQRFAELVQHLPASETHHHAYPGGMLDHGLEIVAYALKMRQSYLLPLGTSPETQAAQTEAWTAAVAYAALLHDIGKIAVDVEVDLASGVRWHPWHGAIKGGYRFRFAKGREYKLHGAAAGLVYTQILSPKILDWLSNFPELWASLIYVLAGQYEHAGILGELVIQADRASVAQELGGNPARAMSAPKHSLQRQLMEGLRHLVAEQLQLNQPGASDGWLTQDALWLVSKTVADKLRAHLLSQGVEGIPSSNSTFFNVLQDHGIIQSNRAGKAIWKAAVDSGSWQMTLTFLKLSPALIWEADKRPDAFAGTVVPEVVEHQESLSVEAENAAPQLCDQSALPSAAPEAVDAGQIDQSASDDVDMLLNLLGMHAEGSPNSVVEAPVSIESSEFIVQETSNNFVGKERSGSLANNYSTDLVNLGARFMSWLRSGIVGHNIVINDAKAKVHSVAGTAFIVTPEIFQRYVQEHPDVSTIAKEEGVSDWRLVQRSFEKMGIHTKRRDGLNIWTCEVKGPRKTRNVKGYLFNDPLCVFTEKPYDNPYLTLITPSGEQE